MGLENRAVLFTDMVGSTALASSVPVDTADQVRRRHFSILRRAVAESGGTEVKNLGDGLMVVFGSASAALTSAVAMQQGISRDNRTAAHPVGLRVGLSCGEATAEEDDYFGDPVIEAARLCARGESGQVLAADVVRLTAGRRCPYECRPVGDLELKGIPVPVTTVEVLWPEDDADGGPGDGVPLPARLGARPAMGLVGRDPQLDLLAVAVEHVMAGEGRQVVLVSGEPGLGKTTLAAEAARAAFAGGACVLFGHCEEDLATPYQLFGEAVGHWVTHAPEEELLAHVAEHGAELGRMVPALGSRVGDLPELKAEDADTERSLLFSAVLGLVATISADTPVVLVLDDLQWADPGSLQLLRHLVASAPASRLLVVGTYRDSELSRSHPLAVTLAAFHREQGVSSIELTGLDGAQVVALLESTAGRGLDDAGVELAHAVHRETDGNPFFVTEVLHHLAETGAISQDTSGRWITDKSLDPVALPESVRVVIGARVGRLAPEAARALSVAAVIGRDFDLDLLARATGLDQDELLDALDAAASASLVHELAEAGRYHFTHALIQHTLYDDLGPSRRARVHRRLAESLEALCGDRPGARVGELARHWMRASQPIDAAKAAEYSRQAGDAALSALAPADAIRHFEAALALIDQLPEHDEALALDVAIGLGTAQRQAGDPTSRATLLDAARRADAAGDVDRLAAAALANSRGMFTSVAGIDGEKIAVLERAIELLPADKPARVLLLATLCSEMRVGRPSERRSTLAHEAIALAEQTGDDATIVNVLNLVHLALCVPELGPSLARTGDALERARRLGDPSLIFWSAQWRAETAAAAGDADEVDRCLELRRPCIEQLDQPFLRSLDTFTRAWRAQLAGDLDELDALVVRHHEEATSSPQPDAELGFAFLTIATAWQRGSLGDVIPFLEHAMALPVSRLPWFRSTLAVAYSEDGRADDAQRLLDEFASSGFDLPEDQDWIMYMAQFAEVAFERRDRPAAAPLYDRLAPYHEQFTTTGVTGAAGPVSHYLGGLAHVLGRHDDANTYFAESAAMNERMRARFFAARTDLAWGRTLAERDAPGDDDTARTLLTKARTAAAANGYALIERRAAQALASMGRPG